MTLSLYAQYAAVTFIFALMFTIVALSIKSWIDEQTVASTLWLQNEYNRMNAQRLMGTFDDFDAHVQSTPGMQNLN